MKLDDRELLWKNFEKFKVNENEYDLQMPQQKKLLKFIVC